MRWVRYASTKGTRYGIVEGDRVIDVDGSPFDVYQTTGLSLPLDEIKILIPFVPRNFFAVGYNYLGHTKEAEEFLKSPKKVPTQPDVGSRFPSSLIAHDEDVIVPKSSSGVVQFEGELVAVVGRKARGLDESEILSCLLGYTIGNDFSERSWQAADRTVWRAKSADTFSPMGPWVETNIDLESLVTRIRLNGEQVSQFNTNNMIFGVARYLSEINQFITLQPGDMIWMGAEAPSLDMRPGDVVEVEIDQIGTLRNRIVQG
jgi:2-keto-4-pentenoate hydratase/2-oxohepta-3-ene-1,7-dioic acid hydratase in catechol pathway